MEIKQQVPEGKLSKEKSNTFWKEKRKFGHGDFGKTLNDKSKRYVNEVHDEDKPLIEKKRFVINCNEDNVLHMRFEMFVKICNGKFALK